MARKSETDIVSKAIIVFFTIYYTLNVSTDTSSLQTPDTVKE